MTTPRLNLGFRARQVACNPQAPIEVKSGALFLARRAGAQILPLVLRYEWLAESRPSVFIQIGQPLAAETSPDKLATILNQLFARIDAALDPATVHPARDAFPGAHVDEQTLGSSCAFILAPEPSIRQVQPLIHYGLDAMLSDCRHGILISGGDQHRNQLETVRRA